jgi:hypothetical protein
MEINPESYLEIKKIFSMKKKFREKIRKEKSEKIFE